MGTGVGAGGVVVVVVGVSCKRGIYISLSIIFVSAHSYYFIII